MKTLSLVAVVAFTCFAGNLAANGEIFDVDWADFGCPGDKTAKFEEYLSYGADDYLSHGDFCYRVEVTCPEGVIGGFGTSLANDGGVGFGGGFDNPDSGTFCGWGGAHFRNSEFSHTCTFDGELKLEVEVKAVDYEKCEKED